MKAPNNLHNIVDVFLAFLKLGLTAFGGPIAHIGYFRTEFIIKRQWLSEQQFSQLLAVTQFLPGPASSQMGFSIGFFSRACSKTCFAIFNLPKFTLTRRLAWRHCCFYCLHPAFCITAVCFCRHCSSAGQCYRYGHY